MIVAAELLSGFIARGWAFRLAANGEVKAAPPPDGATGADLHELRQHRDAIRDFLASGIDPADVVENASVIQDRDGCTWAAALHGAARSAGLDTLNDQQKGAA